MALDLFRITEFVSEDKYENAELYLAPEGKNFLFVYRIEGKYFAQYNAEIYGGYDGIEKIGFRKNGKVFFFKYSYFSKTLGLIKDANQDYLNLKGREIGPFSKIADFKFNVNISYFMHYETYGNSFVVINNNKFGAYKKVYKVFISPEGDSHAIHYKDSGREYIKINDEVFGGYEDVKYFNIDYDNKFVCFVYKKETKEYFAKINNMLLGPFENCSEVHYEKDSGGYYYLTYKRNGSWFIQVNTHALCGFESYEVNVFNKEIAVISSLKEKESVTHIILNELGVFSYVSEYCLSASKEQCVFSYFKMGQYYVVAGGYEYGPFKSVSDLGISTNGENYCFVFQKQYDNYYVNINGEIYGPYIRIFEVKVGNNEKNYGFIFMKNAKYFVNTGGELHGLYDSASNLVLSDNGNGYCYKFSKRSKAGPLFSKITTYLSINGEISEDDIEVLDYRTNSLGFNAIVFKRAGEWFVSLNETLLGPYAGISEWRFLPDDSLFAFKFREERSDTDNLQINGKIYTSRNKNLQIYSPIFSTDKKRFAFIHYSQSHYYIQITDETYGPFDHANFPSFSPDNKLFIFKYQNQGGIYLNINGMKLGPFSKAEYTFNEGKLYISYLQEKTVFIDEISWIL